jgi:uncharacterized protein YaaR (DUF327 family)
MDVTDVIVNQIDDKFQQLQEAVSSGRADTFEEYKKTCGEIKGLLIARGYALDLKQRLESSDE